MMRKLKEGSREWKQRLLELALGEAPPIITCRHCGTPTLYGYVCRYCGSDEPGDNVVDPLEHLAQWEEQMADDLIGNAPEGTTEMTVTRIIQKIKGGPRVLATIHLELAALRANGDPA